MNKVFLLLSIIACTFIACKQEDENPSTTQSEKYLTGVSSWKSLAIFSGNSLLTGTNYLKYEITFLPKGTSGLSGGIKLNNITLPVGWSVVGNSFSLDYASNYTSVTGFEKGSFTGLVEVSANQLEFTASPFEDSNLFGIISIPAGSTLRFTPSGSSAQPGSASGALTTTYLAQLYTVGSDGSKGVPTGSTYKMVFKNSLGVNSLLIGSLTTPTTWALYSDNATLVFNYPASTSLDQSAGIAEFTVIGVIPSATGGKFRIRNKNPNTEISLYGIFKIKVREELELTRQ